MLESAKTPHDLQEVVSAVENAAPAPARPAFQKQLRQQLLLKYQPMATAHKDKKAKAHTGSHSPMRNKGWSMALAVLVLLVVSGVASYPLIPAPEVQGYSLKNTLRKISYNAPIRIVFSQPMDQGSVEKAFKMEPKVDGTFEWQNNSLYFKPKEQFKVGDMFKVTLDRSARSIIQKPLNSEYDENFQIVPAPAVTLFSPAADSTQVPVDGKITVHFDRPMIALTTLDQSNEKAIDVQVDPPIKGKVKWLGTSSMMFMPDRLAYATHYTVKVPQGTVSAEGGTTDKDFVASFDTVKPSFEGTNFMDAYPYMGPNEIIKMNFNQPMNLEKAGSFIKFYKLQGEKDLARNIQWNGDIYGLNGKEKLRTTEDVVQMKNLQWQEVPVSFHYYTAEEYKKDYIQDGTNYSGPASQFETQEVEIPKLEELQKTLVVKQAAPFDEDTVYLVKVLKDYPGAEGTFGLEQESNQLFKTVGALNLVSSYPENNAKDYGSKGEAPCCVGFTFNQQMDSESFQDKVVIEPKVIGDDKKEKKPEVSVSDVTLEIRYPFEPSTKYTVTVKAGGKSQYGKVLDKDLSVSFTTAALQPSFHLVSSPDISVLDATKPRVYYVKSTNVDSVNFEFKKLSEEEFGKIYERGYVNNFRPADGYSTFTKQIKKDFNHQVVTKIDLEKDFGQTLDPGYYYFEVTSPQVFDLDYDGKRIPQIEKQVFVVTGYALATKMSNKQLLVWATSMREGKPVEGMDIQAKSSTDGSILSAKTDKDGLATLPLPKKDDTQYLGEYMVTGKVGGDITLSHSTWSEGVSPWNFNIDYSSYNEKYFVYLYTDRPIYRPGHSVNFKGLVRVNNDMKYSLPDRSKILVTVRDESGQEVYKKELAINKNGTFNGDFQLGELAGVGGYQMVASLAAGDEPEYSHSFYHGFRVAAYRKPDYLLNLKPDKTSYANGETANVKVNSQFFFGAPLADADVNWTVKTENYYFFIPADSKSPYASQWYSFSDEGYLCYWGCKGESKIVSEGRGKTDANGDYTVQLPLNIKDAKLSQFYTLEANVSDLNHQNVANRTTFPVHQGEYYVGIMSQDYVATKGKEAKFDVITVDKDGNPVAGKNVEVSLMKREWNTVKKKQVDSDFYFENNYEDVQKEKKTVTTDDKGHTTVSFVANEGGSYKVATSSNDSKGNRISSATEMYVTSGDFVNWGQENNDRIELVPDKQEYQVGDTAHVLVKSPYQNVYALVTHERGDIVYKKVMKIASNSETIDVPITNDSLPNEFVSVLLVKGNNTAAGLQDPGTEIDERDVASFKLGYATLQVDTSSRKLGIEVSSDRAKYHPGDEVTLKVKTSDASGKPVKAEVSIGVVDKSVLSLTENVTADLLSDFYRKRYLGVSTSETLTKALSRLNVQVESGLKGGGGGAIAKRGVFKDTAYWQAVVNTDGNGQAEVKFKLPDNLTTWQVMSIGITNDTLVGSQRLDFLVTKDVLARPVLPRFMIVNDAMTVGTVVHNYLDRAVDLDVALKANGLAINGSDKQRVRLEPGKEQRVDFNVTVQDQPEAVITFEAIDANDKTVGDIVEEKLPIHTFSFPEVVATSAEVIDDTKHVETVWLPNGIDPKFGELKITASSTLAGTFAKGIEYLVQFPYGCAEQTASSLLPNLAVKQIAKLPGLGVDKLIDEKELKKNVEAGVQALYKYQQSNGGWGIWENSTPTPYLSAYVLYTLNEVKKAGYTVDENVMQRGLDYVKNSMKDLPLAGERSEGSYNANSRAFALFVLAEMNKGDLGLSNNLYENKKYLSLFGKAYLAMTFKDLGGDNADLQKKIDTLKGEILNVAKESPRGVHFEEASRNYMLFDTNTRTTAIVLQMLSRVDSNNPLVPKILRHMLMEKKDGHYATTQETAITLLAMADYLKSSKELQPSYNGVIALNGVEKLNGSFQQTNINEVREVTIPLKDLLQNNQDNEVTATRQGVGKMYFDMNLKYFLPTEKIASRDEGILVTQEYFTMDDKKLENPVNSVKVGENLVGKMTIIVPEDRYYVMVEDYLPAGLEGVDFNLQTSRMDLQDMMEEAGSNPCKGVYSWECWEELWRFNHSEVRDDRMMFFADMLPAGVYELKYVVRATSPGTFHDLPALAQETYFPEIFGRSAGSMFTVQP